MVRYLESRKRPGSGRGGTKPSEVQEDSRHVITQLRSLQTRITSSTLSVGLVKIKISLKGSRRRTEFVHPHFS